VARLRVVGVPAFPRLALLIASRPAPAIVAAALRALEGLDDARVDPLAVEALSAAETDVAIAAIGVLRGRIAGDDGVGALDALTAAALDAGRESTVRLAALDALSDLPRELVGPVLERARRDVDTTAPADDPIAAREWLASRGRRAPLSVVHDIVLRAREQGASGALRSADWLATRGAAHAVLAGRGSRVALYDLREAFDMARTPLPLDFLTAIGALGDASCLEPLARSWAALPDEAWWRDRLAEAAREIVRRRRLGGRNAAVVRVRAKWPGFL
jgi:hypothetical protein